MKNPYEKHFVDHDEYRSARRQSKWITSRMIDLIGRERAKEYAVMAIRSSLTDQGQLDPAKVRDYLDSALRLEELHASGRKGAEKYHILKNVQHFLHETYLDKTNRKINLESSVASLEYTNLDQIRKEYPHLWITKI